MLTRYENDIKDCRLLGSEIGASIGGFMSLALSDNLISVFILTTAIGVIFGSFFKKIKITIIYLITFYYFAFYSLVV